MKRTFLLFAACLLLAGCSKYSSETAQIPAVSGTGGSGTALSGAYEEETVSVADVLTETVLITDEATVTENTPAPEETVPLWQKLYYDFLVNEVWRVSGGSANYRDMETYFQLVYIDNDEIPELAVTDDFEIALYHISTGEEHIPHVCPFISFRYGDFASHEIKYKEGEGALMYLEASRAAMHGYCSYIVYTAENGLINSDCYISGHGIDERSVILRQQQDAPVAEEYEETSAEDILLLEQLGIEYKGDPYPEFSDDWKCISADSGDAWVISEENASRVLFNN